MTTRRISPETLFGFHSGSLDVSRWQQPVVDVMVTICLRTRRQRSWLK